MTNFWAAHGIFFIIFMFFFPRITTICSVLFFGMISGGFLWWLGLIFMPRLLVAILATYAYWNTNTFLCVLTWVWAITGEFTEKECINKSI